MSCWAALFKFFILLLWGTPFAFSANPSAFASNPSKSSTRDRSFILKADPKKSEKIESESHLKKLKEHDLILNEQTKNFIRKSFDPKSRQAEGGWSGNGGDGLVCFTSQNVAEKALDSQGRLTDQARHEIVSVTVPDLDFSFQNKNTLISPTNGQSAKQFLQERVQKVFGTATPYFASQLQTSIDLLYDSQDTLPWSVQQSLPKLNDGKSIVFSWVPNYPIEKSCRFVQIIIRYQKKIPNSSQPLVFFDYDQNLFSRLGGNDLQLKILFQASLIYHEALYLLGIDGGDKNSNATRDVNHNLFSYWYDPSFEDFPPYKQFLGAMWQLDFYSFNNFWNAFINPNNSLQVAKANLENRERNLREQLYQEKKIESPKTLLLAVHPADRQQVIQKMAMTISLPIEAFVYLAYHYYTDGKSEVHPDYLLLESENSAVAKTFYCDLFEKELEKVSANPSLLKSLLESSVLFCKAGN